MLKAIAFGSSTLVGVPDEEFPLSRGNCFSLEVTSGEHYKIVNFIHENLEESIRLGVKWPIYIMPISNSIAVIHDKRIPDNWYEKTFCEVCCPNDLLPFPQQLKRQRQELQGVRTVIKSDTIDIIKTDMSKRPILCEADKPRVLEGKWTIDPIAEIAALDGK